MTSTGDTGHAAEHNRRTADRIERAAGRPGDGTDTDTDADPRSDAHSDARIDADAPPEASADTDADTHADTHADTDADTGADEREGSAEGVADEESGGRRRLRRPLPEAPTALPGRAWWAVLKRTVRESRDDGVTDWAAALTYYGVLSIFPAIVVLVSVLGLLGKDTTQSLIDNLGTVAPGATRDILTNAIEQLQESHRGTAGTIAILGLVGALWSASGYVAAFMRAANAVYDIPEGRPFWKTTPVRLGLTVVLMALLAISSVAVVFTGGLARRAGDLLGVGDTAVTVFDIVKWPLLVFVVMFMVALLYWAAPNVRQPGFRWITPGGMLALLVWLAGSVGFAFYVGNFGSYNKTYGTLASVIIFLVWLWLSNIAILLGVELNAELERQRGIVGGLPPEEEPYVELRDTRKVGKSTRRQ